MARASTSPANAAAVLDSRRAREVQRFEAEVSKHSMRGDHPEYALGYYVSLELLHALNKRAKRREQVNDTNLQRLVLVPCNAKMFFHAVAARHSQVDELLLAARDAERPEKITQVKRTRLQQIEKCVDTASFRDRFEQTRNGDKLYARLKELVTSVLAAYSPSDKKTKSNELVDNDKAPAFAPDPKVCTAKPRASPMSPTSRVQRALFNEDEEEEREAAPQKARAVDSSIFRAYKIYRASPDRFTAYYVYFKNDSIPLATEISRRCSDKVAKKEIREWIKTMIGPIPAFVPPTDQGSKRQTTFRNCELRNLALVAAALTQYSESRLSTLVDTDSSVMASCEDIPLVSDELRDASAQIQCVKMARSGESSVWLPTGDLHAAHYLPIDLAIQWNNFLPVESRVSTSSLRSVLNLQVNLKAVPAQVNVKHHRKVEHFVAAFIRDGESASHKCRTWLQRRNFWDRLMVIAQRVQTPAFRDALVRERNGEAFFNRVALTFQQIEREFVSHGFGSFGKLWGSGCGEESAAASHARRIMNVFLELLE